MTAVQKLILILFPYNYWCFVMVSAYLPDAEINF